MRFGVVGLGSMGKRRVRDLSGLGHEVLGFDLRADRNEQAAKQFSVRTVDRFEALVDAGLDAVMISTPPDQHQMYYERCFAARIPFFAEANVLTPRAEWFASQEAAAGIRSFTSATMRFHPLVAQLYERVRERPDALLSMHHRYGGFLPQWHPWEGYHEYYAGRDRRVNAARETVPFEIDWLAWLFGPVKAVCAVQQRRYPWTTDIDDSYYLLLEFESGLPATLIIELHPVIPIRETRVSLTGSGLVLDIGAAELRHYDLESNAWRFLKPGSVRLLGSFDYEQIYQEETRAFVAALRGEPSYAKTWEDDRHASNVLYAAEESVRRKSWVPVAEVEALYDGQSWTRE